MGLLAILLTENLPGHGGGGGGGGGGGVLVYAYDAWMVECIHASILHPHASIHQSIHPSMSNHAMYACIMFTNFFYIGLRQRK